MTRYILTGTTGALGSRIFRNLIRLVPASDIVVSVYNPSGATEEVKSSGVEIRKGDFEDPASLDSAFAGADKLLIVSYPSIAHELRVRNHISAIDAAKRVGIKHIYYTSLAFADDSVAAVMQAHLDTEKYLKESGLTCTIIREGIYSESWPLYFGFFDPKEGKDEVLILYSDGKIAWVCRDDLGEGTAKIIAADVGYENQTLLLSGDKPISFVEFARIVSQILPGDRHITVKVVSEDEYVKNNLGKQSKELLRPWSTTYKALERAELEKVDPLLKTLLGRELRPIEETLKEMLDAQLGDGGKGATARYAK
ncbi:hypothetical protein QCA50_005069 [Cerrena zonata]|uniref:NmrA-like domain-containing protein n=1 Tax=Cerrena zonata TaxID=2478898 RepID=A0AAW0GKP7_9APHY